MSRVITFSRTYPKGHRKEGQATDFIPKIWASLLLHCRYNFELNYPELENEIKNYFEDKRIITKHHTMRAGHRWKAGDFFSPRVWSGKPYNSKQITIAPPIEVKKTWDIVIDACGVMAIGEPNKQVYYLEEQQEEEIANNDGLSEDDFRDWLIMPVYRTGKEWSGQIICWNEKINYK